MCSHLLISVMSSCLACLLSLLDDSLGEWSLLPILLPSLSLPSLAPCRVDYHKFLLPLKPSNEVYRTGNNLTSLLSHRQGNRLNAGVTPPLTAPQWGIPGAAAILREKVSCKGPRVLPLYVCAVSVCAHLVQQMFNVQSVSHVRNYSFIQISNTVFILLV